MGNIRGLGRYLPVPIRSLAKVATGSKNVDRIARDSTSSEMVGKGKLQLIGKVSLPERLLEAINS